MRSRATLKFAVSLVIVVALGAYPLLIAGAGGAIGIPRNDDWVYLRSAFHLLETGEFHPFTSSASMVGQSAIGAAVASLFGEQVIALQLTGIALGIGALVITFLLCRAYSSTGIALAAVAVVALGPIYSTIGATFMTDVPAYFFMMASLGAGVIAASRTTRATAISWLAASLVLGAVGFSIREFAIAAPLAALAVYAIRARPLRASIRDRWPEIVLAIAFAASVVAFYVWRKTVAGNVSGLRVAIGDLALPFRALVTLGILTIPAVALAVPVISRLRSTSPRRRLWLWVLLGAAIFVALGLLWKVLSGGGDGGVVGNYLTRSIAYSDAGVGSPEFAFSSPAWAAIVVAGVAAATAAGAFAIANLRIATLRSLPQRRPVELALWTFTVLYLAIWLTSSLVLGSPAFDRNLLPITPFLLVFVLRAAVSGVKRKRTAFVVAAAGGIAVACIGLVASTSSATVDSIKWRAGELAVSSGVPATSVDAGYEWVGFHRPELAHPQTTADPRYSWWVRLFPAGPVCAVVLVAPPPVETDVDGTVIAPADPLAEVEADTLLGADYKARVYPGPDDGC